MSIVKILEENKVSICYDTDLSTIYYNSWKNDIGDNLLILGSGMYGPDYIVIGKLGSPYYSKSELNSMKKSDLIDLAEYYGFTHIYVDWIKKEIISELMDNVTIRYHYETQYNETRWYDLECDFTVIGYSQGDAVKVKILSDEYKYNTKEYLTNIFYDTPISGTILFKGYEYYIDEYLDNQYDYWDKDKFISAILKDYLSDDKDEFKAFLEYSLPAVLDYV